MKYTTPEMEIVIFDAEEVIVASAVVTTTTEEDTMDSEEW